VWIKKMSNREPSMKPLFHEDSYGYISGKSALDAVGTVRKRCWWYDWVIDLDIQGFFDNIDHELMMHAVRKHTDSKWVLLYVERWLKAPAQMEDGSLVERGQGTPQGGVISPLLANIFLHHVFDEWMKVEHPGTPFARYADDIIVHCRTKAQAQGMLRAIEMRLARCKLKLHPDKTKIVYCKDADRSGSHDYESFDFLGYCFRPRIWKGRRYFVGQHYTPSYVRLSTLLFVGRCGNTRGCEAVGSKRPTGWVVLHAANLDSLCPGDSVSSRRLDSRSRMTGDCHVRFSESVEVRLPYATQPYQFCGTGRSEFRVTCHHDIWDSLSSAESVARGMIPGLNSYRRS